MKIDIRKICVGLLVAALVVIPVAAYAGEGTPQRAKGLFADLVILDANIITMDVENPMYEESSRAEALAVRDGKIVAVGDTSQIFAKYVGSDTEVIDAEGKTVTPGFNDSHLHPSPMYTPGSPYYTVPLGPAYMEQTMDALIATLSAQADVTTAEWVKGSGYEDTKLGRHPTREDLDQVSTEHFILISHSSYHVFVVNSLCLETAGVTKDTPDPVGGSFGRYGEGHPIYEAGTPNGVCYEGAARNVATANCPPSPRPTEEEYQEGLYLFFQNLSSKGLTSIGDAGVGGSKIKSYQDMLANEMLPVRINMMVSISLLPELKELGLMTGFGDDRLQIGPVKLMAGNSLSGRTCWLWEPYVGSYEGQEYYGVPHKLLWNEETNEPDNSELVELIYAAHEAGFQIAIHSNGDREVDMLLDAFVEVFEDLPRENHRHRIEHCSVVTESIIQRIADLDLVIALHSYTYDHGDKFVDYGPDRWPLMHANKSMLEAGIVVCQNSDCCVSAPDPMIRIQSMVTRATAGGTVYGPEQIVSPDQAIWTWTVGSAYSSFEEDIKGSIEVGKLADIVILSDDPNEVDPFEIKDIEVVMTILGGEIVYES